MENSDYSGCVAVIGLSCRFPGEADNAENFWQLLYNAKSAISNVPDHRWRSSAFQRDESGTTNKRNMSHTNRAYFLKQDVSKFDATFFSISRSEADSMDPQQRLMLEVSYEAFENAGLPLQSLANSQTGCWISSFSSDWRDVQFSDIQSIPRYAMSGMQPEMLANRVSHFFNLHGPSMTLHSACSGGMVALHVACRSLQAGDCETALVGGSNLLLNPSMFIALSNQNFLAPDGLCKAFDDSADGYGRGEGVAAIILKPIEKAMRDGDSIRAVIRAIGTNQDGLTNGVTMPNGKAQEALIRSTYKSAGLDLKDTPYFEAHGTGTQLGDFEELTAIAKSVARARKEAKMGPLWIGSVKTNIGHLEAVAGLAGVIKAIMMVEQGIIPPNLNFQTPNSRIKFGECHIRVPTRGIIKWKRNENRRVSVNSFGFGGSNAHVIIDNAQQYLHGRKISVTYKPKLAKEYPHSTSTVQLNRGPQLFILAANDQEGLNRQRTALCKYINHAEQRGIITDRWLLDLAYTLGVRRSTLPWMSYCLSSTAPALGQALTCANYPTIRHESVEPRLGYIFTGQGAQWARMGVELLEFPTFKESIGTADECLRRIGCPWSVVEELQRDESETNIHNPWYSQTLCTVLQVALIELLQSWNLLPRSVAGHSSGEIAAAFAIGAINREDAWKIAYWRGKFASELSERDPGLKGAMLAVGASAGQTQLWIDSLSDGKCVLACINSPSSVTVSGDETSIDELSALLNAKGIFVRKLMVKTAYHSNHMQVIADPYLDAIGDICVRSVPNHGIRLFTSTTGRLAVPSDLHASHWVANLVSPVLFSSTITELIRPKDKHDELKGSAIDILVEIGPHAALRGPVMQILQGEGLEKIEYFSILSRRQNAIWSTLSIAAELACRGLDVCINAVNNAYKLNQTIETVHSSQNLVNLPSYAWNHSKTFWSESRLLREARKSQHLSNSFIGLHSVSNIPGQHSWRGFLTLDDAPWIRDHMVETMIAFPAGGFLSMALEAARIISERVQGHTTKGCRLNDIQFHSALVLTEESKIEHIMQLVPHDDVAHAQDEGPVINWWRFTISSSSNPEEELKCNCTGLVAIESDSIPEHSTHLFDQSFTTKQDVHRFYAKLSSVGLIYGPNFQSLVEIMRGSDGCAKAQMEIDNVTLATTDAHSSSQTWMVQPTTMEALFQIAYAAFDNLSHGITKPLRITKIDELRLSVSVTQRAGSRVQTYAKSTRLGFHEMAADIQLYQTSCDSLKGSVTRLVCVEVPSVTNNTNDLESASECNYEAMLSKMVWIPTVLHSSSSNLEMILDKCNKFTNTQVEEQRQLNINNYLHLKEAVELSKDVRVSIPKRRNAVKWITQELQQNDLSKMEYEYTERNSPGLLDTQLVASVLRGSSPEAGVLGSCCCTAELLYSTLGIQLSLYKMYQLVSNMTYENPDLSILEIGMGTVRNGIVSALSGLGIPSVVMWTRAVATLEELQTLQTSPNIPGCRTTFIVLDLEQDLAAQGFDPSSYDIIIGTNVLSASRNMETTITNITTLLRPRGHICFVELTKPSARHLPVLATLCDWWKRGDDGLRRPLPTDVINDMLSQQGFNGVRSMPDFQDPVLHESTLFFGSISGNATQKPPFLKEKPVYILIPHTMSASCALVENVVSLFPNSQPSYWRSETNFENQHIISLLEAEQPFIHSLTEADFTRLQRLVMNAASLLWVTGIPEPYASSILGLARVIRFERPSLDFRVLGLDLSTKSNFEQVSQQIVQVLRTDTFDREFKVFNSVVHIPRIVIDTVANQHVSNVRRNRAVNMKYLRPGISPLKLSIANPGLQSSVYFEENWSLEGALADDEIELDVKASGLTPRDVMVALGDIVDTRLGLDASGIVSRVGASVTHLQVGDRAVMLAAGAHGTVLRAKSFLCQKLPSGTTYEDAAGFFMAFCEAYYVLFYVLRAQNGQSILIHAAAGAVGQLCIRLAQDIGLTVFATAESPECRVLLQESLDLSAQCIYHPRSKDLFQQIMGDTGNIGVDFIINPLSREVVSDSWDCLANLGTFVQLGKEARSRNPGACREARNRDITHVTVSLSRLLELRPKLVGEILQKAILYIQRDEFKTITPSHAYSVADTKSALDIFRATRCRGKTSLLYSADASVPVIDNTSTTLKLSESNTYLIAGGLGGIGLSIANLLANCGARHLALLSRSGVTSSLQKKAMEAFKLRGVQVGIYKCNIGDRVALEEALSQCAREMPPLMGVIHSATVFRDSTFNNMTYNQWSEVLDGSIMAVVGGMGQANYATAGAFQDGLAYIRRAQGRPSVTIDLGIVKGIGAIEDRGAVGHTLEWREYFGVDDQQVNEMVKSVLLQQIKAVSLPAESQIINSIPTGGMVSAAKINCPYYYNDPRFSILAKTGLDLTASGIQTSQSSTREQLKRCSSEKEAVKVVLVALISKIARLMQMPEGEVDIGKSLFEYGVDSLVAIEYVSWTKKELDVEVDTSDVLSSKPIIAFARNITMKGRWGSGELKAKGVYNGRDVGREIMNAAEK